MKSRIAWGNHIMRKFGGNIRREIERIAVHQHVKIKKYRQMQMIRDIEKQAVWFDPKPMRG